MRAVLCCCYTSMHLDLSICASTVMYGCMGGWVAALVYTQALPTRDMHIIYICHSMTLSTLYDMAINIYMSSPNWCFHSHASDLPFVIETGCTRVCVRLPSQDVRCGCARHGLRRACLDESRQANQVGNGTIGASVELSATAVSRPRCRHNIHLELTAISHTE